MLSNGHVYNIFPFYQTWVIDLLSLWLHFFYYGLHILVELIYTVFVFAHRTSMHAVG